MVSRISKKAINFVLETLEDINNREAAEWAGRHQGSIKISKPRIYLNPR
jgi:hypothetical protein